MITYKEKLFLEDGADDDEDPCNGEDDASDYSQSEGPGQISLVEICSSIDDGAQQDGSGWNVQGVIVTDMFMAG